MKILIITPTSWQITNFRSYLIKLLQKNNHDISVITFDSKHKEEIIDNNIKFYFVPDNNRSKNPFRILTLKAKLLKKINIIKPDVVLTFMLKPNTYGVLAAKKAGTKRIYSVVEGAGDVFVNQSVLWKLIRIYVQHLYKKSFVNNHKVFFLNKDDRQEFIDRKIVNITKTDIIHGIGVDTNKFNYEPIKNDSVFLMVARMLRNKGVYEYLECARIVKKMYPNVVFNYVGGEGDIGYSDIREYIEDGSIIYYGYTNDVKRFYADSTVFVLPSYREGFPVSIMEAQSTGRMVITTKTNGCKETVIDGHNGFLIEKCNTNSLVDKVLWCVNNKDKVKKMGDKARIFAENNFNENKVNSEFLEKLRFDTINRSEEDYA